MVTIRNILRSTIRQSYRHGLFHIRSRDEFPFVLNARALIGDGAEVGVHKGSYSEFVLTHWHGRKLFSIDPWMESDREVCADGTPVTQLAHDDVFSSAERRLERFGVRSEMMRRTSRDAAHSFADGQLDFVYIDALHYYEDVRDDIELWYPNVRKGGILAGHDYVDGWAPNYVYGVKSAVDELRSVKRSRLAISREAISPSWFFLV